MTSDEGLHEIQLNGKQLVFLFMAGTVVFVVIFLCGVLVGRGVRGRVQLTEVAAQAAADPTAPEAAAPGSASTAPAPASTTGSSAPAEPETLTYPDRLEDDNAPPETLGEPIDPTASARRSRAVPPPPSATETPLKAPAAARAKESAAAPRTAQGQTPAPAPPAASAAATPATASAAKEPAGNGFVVQVAAVRERAEADTIARRLTSKGYPTFVTTSGAAGPRVFRVRVGRYPDRRAAESVKTRLEKEEQFKPWVTR